MSHTITIRLTDELLRWLEEVSRRTGIPKGRIIREHLEQVRKADPEPTFLRLAGSVHGPRDLSSRKGFETQ